MKIALQSTNEFAIFNGAWTRIWVGELENGIPCRAFIAQIAVSNLEDTTEIEKELDLQNPPTITIL